jgi:hypothetical protein
MFLFPYQPAASYTSIPPDFASSFIRIFTGATSYDIRTRARQDSVLQLEVPGFHGIPLLQSSTRPLDEIVQLLNNSITANLDLGEHPILFHLCFAKETHKELALYNLLTCKGSNTTRLLNYQSSNNDEDKTHFL